jgi:hypothetical protein
MIELILLNERGEQFSKLFSSHYLANKFKAKIRYSKKLKLIGELKHY